MIYFWSIFKPHFKNYSNYKFLICFIINFLLHLTYRYYLLSNCIINITLLILKNVLQLVHITLIMSIVYLISISINFLLRTNFSHVTNYLVMESTSVWLTIINEMLTTHFWCKLIELSSVIMRCYPGTNLDNTKYSLKTHSEFLYTSHHHK